MCPPLLQNLELGILVECMHAWQKRNIGVLEKNCSYDARIIHAKHPAKKRYDQGFTTMRSDVARAEVSK